MKSMTWLLSAVLFLSIGFSACTEDEAPQIIDPTVPTGTFVVQRSGSFTAQNGTPTAGSAALGVDDDNETFLRFADGFVTELATGTVTVYLSTSENFVADPGNGNPDLKLVGVVAENGENFFRISSTVDSKYTHVILWCGSANIPFGYAPLQ
ncbi:MAG TPA: DM13 domain-containing protein [Saprospiraceae bacterium]|nr:DM13 domain-containing protein [Saprospiraceae bacterium]HMQ85252.1 DM13 domain-containing protein [Saprospiraceae bacterium]